MRRHTFASPEESPDESSSNDGYTVVSRTVMRGLSATVRLSQAGTMDATQRFREVKEANHRTGVCELQHYEDQALPSYRAAKMGFDPKECRRALWRDEEVDRGSEEGDVRACMLDASVLELKSRESHSCSSPSSCRIGAQEPATRFTIASRAWMLVHVWEIRGTSMP